LRANKAASIWYSKHVAIAWSKCHTPFTRSSKHWADIEQTSSRRRAISTCISNTFARRLLDVCSFV